MTLNPYHFNNPPFHWDNPFQEEYNVLSYGAKGDGTTDDAAAIQAALDAAIANLPATVYFPPGNYIIESGIDVQMTQGDRGLSVVGAGADVSRIIQSGSTSWSTNFHALKIEPSSAPTAGVTANYIKDILIKDIGFYDDDPELHAQPLTITGTIDTGVDATAVTLSGNFTEADGTYIRIAGAGAAGANLLTSVASGTGTSSIVIDTAASTDVTDAVIHGTKSGTSEETHGVNVQYGYGVKVLNCNFESIGDESIEVDYCEDVIISNNKFIDTPAAELSGGACISIKHGCENVSVANNVIDGYGSGAYNVYGINIKIINATATKNVSISDNVIRNTQSAGINFNNAAAVTCSNISITNNIIDTSIIGINRTGNNPSEFLSIIGNTITNLSDGIGIRFDVGKANNSDLVAAFNNIDTITGTAPFGIGIVANGTRLNFSGNNISNCADKAIHLADCADTVVSGGIIDTCGGTAIPIIEDDSATPTSLIEGVKITNGAATVSVIQDCATVKDCDITNDTETTRHIDGSSATPLIATGNRLNGGIRVESSKSNVSNNNIIFSGTPATNIIRCGANDDLTLIGNYIEAAGTRTAIECTGTYCNTSHNNVRNSHTTTGVITNAGTGAVSQDNIT